MSRHIGGEAVRQILDTSRPGCALNGVAFGWIGGIALTALVLLAPYPNRELAFGPWIMGTCVWLVGPMIGIANPRAGLCSARPRKRSLAQWFAEIAVAVPV